MLDDDAPIVPEPAPAPTSIAPALARGAAAAGFAAALATAERTPELEPEPALLSEAAARPAACARTSTPPSTPSRRRATRAPRSCPVTTAAAPAAVAVAPAPSFVARAARRARAAPRPPAACSRPSTPGPAEHPEVERVLSVLHRAGLSESFATALVGEAAVHGLPFAEGEAPARLRPFVARALARRLDVAPLRSASAVAVVGAGGAGKTAVIARLATAYAAARRLPVAVIALRPKDGGAELARLLAPAGVPLWATDDVEGAAARIANLRRGALVLVDTPAVPARAGAERDALVADLRRLGLDEVHLALPAVLAGEVAREMLAAARDLGADRIAVTHTDATARLGMAVELAVEADLPISYLADSVTRAPRRRRGPGLRPAPMSLPAFDTPVMIRVPDREVLPGTRELRRPRVARHRAQARAAHAADLPRAPRRLPGVRRPRRASCACAAPSPCRPTRRAGARRRCASTTARTSSCCAPAPTRAASCTRASTS